MKILKLLFITLFAIILSSCAKEELVFSCDTLINLKDDIAQLKADITVLQVKNIQLKASLGVHNSSDVNINKQISSNNAKIQSYNTQASKKETEYYSLVQQYPEMAATCF